MQRQFRNVPFGDVLCVQMTRDLKQHYVAILRPTALKNKI